MKKLNLATRTLVDIAHFPGGVRTGCAFHSPLAEITSSNEVQFESQLYRTTFSRDFQKMIAAAPKPGQVAYYDSKLGEIVVASNSIPQPTGDFAVDSSYGYPYFTDSGLLTFSGGVIDSKRSHYFFDTDHRSIVKTAADPEFPSFLQPAINMDDTARHRDYTASGESGYAAVLNTSSGQWLINAKTYLSDRYFDKNYTMVGSGWVLRTMPTERGDGGPFIQEISPKTADILGVAADPEGSTILMMVNGKGSLRKLYKVNLKDPNSPTEVDLNGALGQSLADPEIRMVAWE